MKNLILIILLVFGSASWAVQPGLSFGENDRLDELFSEMQSAAGEGAGSAEREALRIFRQSGSAAMNLLLERGYAALDAGDVEMAVWHFSALIDHAPEFAEAYNGRAAAFYLLGKLGETMADIELAIVLNPRHFGALGGMGVIQEELGHPENALKAYRAALALNPHSQDLLDTVKRVEDSISILH